MKSLRVLIIEDDARIVELIAELLVEHGHTICASATTQSDAVYAASHSRPDLIIVDVELRDGNGIDAVAEIVKSSPVPHVFMTGGGRDARMSGAVVIQKPFRAQAFFNALRQVLTVADPALVL